MFERRNPIEAVEFANSVLSRLGNEVEIYNGTVDRFTGDGFLAHFGILGEDENHVYDACRSAIAMRNALQNTQQSVSRNFQRISRFINGFVHLL
ncbi:MAG: hypothetical protein JJU13_06905 [Balneolaceae bacterium]|nr:hypothetical protein [Balneolaceae bacterium]